MVSELLTLLALVTAAPADSGSAARAEARVTVRIERGVTVRAADARPRDNLDQLRDVRRDCDPAAEVRTACRLVIRDLP